MKYLIIFCLAFISTEVLSQDKSKPVTWKFEVSIDEDGNKILTSTAKLDKNWVVYSQHTEEGGPIPLSFTYNEGPQLIGETLEISESIKNMSDMFGIQVVKFKDEAIFKQKFTASEDINEISGSLRFMSCDGLRCLPHQMFHL